MAPSRTARPVALLCATLLLGSVLASCSGVAPSDTDIRSVDGVTADARRRPGTTPKPTTTAAPTTATPTTAAPTTAAPTTAAPPTTGAPATTPPTTAPTAAASRCERLVDQARSNPARYAASTTFNRPAACLGVRADSATWSSKWFRFANYPGRTDASKRGHISVSFDAYSTPVYSTADATTAIRVFGAGWAYGVDLGNNNTIPWNPTWEPAPGNDMEMVIVDPTTGTEWGLWGVQKVNWTSCLTLENLLAGWRAGIDLCVWSGSIGRDVDGSISNAVTSSGYSKEAGRGMGALQAMALLPTLDEVEKGSINHALNMETYGTMFGPACPASGGGTPGVDCGYAVAPATRLEWWNGPASECGSVAQQNTPTDRAKTVPEGMRFALDMTDAQIDAWLDTKGYTGAKRSTARIFAVALRDYGWIISDTTCWDSAMAVEGVANPKARARWARLGITSPVSDGGSLLSGLITSESQVVTLESPATALVLKSR